MPTEADIIYDKSAKRLYLLELNDCPRIDIHHWPVFSQSRKVASGIIVFLFSNAKAPITKVFVNPKLCRKFLN